MREIDPAAVGARIRQAREDAGLSQTELAIRVGKSRRAVYELEHGDRVPKRSLNLVCQALGVAPNWLLYGYEPKLIDLQRQIIDLALRVERLAALIHQLLELRVEAENGESRPNASSH